jgi:hypothetical protein
MRGSILYTCKENMDKIVRGKTGNLDEDEDRILARSYIVDIPPTEMETINQ